MTEQDRLELADETKFRQACLNEGMGDYAIAAAVRALHRWQSSPRISAQAGGEPVAWNSAELALQWCRENVVSGADASKPAHCTKPCNACMAMVLAAPIAGEPGATYTEICKNPTCPRGGKPVEIVGNAVTAMRDRNLSMGEPSAWRDLADRCKRYLDDCPSDGGHSDAAGGSAFELLRECMEVLRLASAPQPAAVGANQSALGFFPPHNSGERLPSSDAAGPGADASPARPDVREALEPLPCPLCGSQVAMPARETGQVSQQLKQEE